MNSQRLLAAFCCLFAVSGFSALIYESVWSHYLRLYLGHAAYAQALVLAIFMGGMSLGAWLSAASIRRIANPILAYALIEGGTGLIALAFHPLYVFVTDYSLNQLVPLAESSLAAQAIKWGTGAALILPQSILLGATFPLLTSGLLRGFPGEPGRTLGMLYFTNSIGGAVGVLAGGFVLIALVGLPGTILTAGIINVLLAIVVYELSKHIMQPGAERGAPESTGGLPPMILIAALITGLSSFVYEIIWLRMLSMVLGASTHAFELMLSAFITGLALGGYWIRTRTPAGRSGLIAAGWIQILMGTAAFATIPLYGLTFDAMGFFMTAISRSESGYLLFNLSSHLIALAVMLPATFLAGMTLPLFTAILLDRGHGEKSVGQVYAFNTLGAIAGTFLTLFILLPRFQIEGGMLIGSGLDILVGTGFLAMAGAGERAGSLKRYRAAIASIVCVALLSLLFSPDPRQMASGVFRHGRTEARDAESVLAHYDGSTTSVSVLHNTDGVRSLLTNGKPDAAARVAEGGERTGDEDTMVLLGALPLSIKSNARKIAVIGFGSGITTHTLLASPNTDRVDTVEIEKYMYEGARFFEHRSERAFTDPRSHVHFEDAKTFFYLNNEKYDVIVSEPSNPWVSGIASLFSEEFYRMVPRFLEADGIFVQWIHLYESNADLLYSTLKALAASFRDFHIYATADPDLLIVASPHAELPLPGGTLFETPLTKADLGLIDIRSEADLLSRFLADRAMLEPELAASPVPVNSDYFPYVDLQSAKARFINQGMTGLNQIREYPVPLLLHFRPAVYRASGTPVLTGSRVASALAADAYALSGGGAVPDRISESLTPTLPYLDLLRAWGRSCDPHVSSLSWEHAYLNVMIATVAYLDQKRLMRLWREASPTCSDSLTPVQKHLIALMEGYARRDMRRIADNAGSLLSARNRYGTLQKRFLFGSLMLAAVALEEYEDGLGVWEYLVDDVYPNREGIPYPVRLLHAHLSAGRAR